MGDALPPLPSPWSDLMEQVCGRLVTVDPPAVDRLVAELVANDSRWFLAGAGRSGLVARMAAMRLMQLGRRAHVVGDTTTPAIAADDGLILLSGSGETVSMLLVAEAALRVGASIWAVTANAGSRLESLADHTLSLGPDRSNMPLSENVRDLSLLALLDGVFAEVGRRDPSARERMPLQHANLE